MSTGAPAAHGLDAGAHATTGTLVRLRTFHTLDLLRGIAALAIVVFHAGFFYGLPAPPEGQIAVDLFFVMSGFIIAYRYDADLAAGLGAARFLAIRLVRLYPLFLLGTVLGLVPALAAVLGGKGALHRGLVESFPFALVMLPSRAALPRIAELYPLNFVAWSLALEIAVNALYAATFRIWTVRRLALVAAAGVVGLCVCAAVYGRLKYGYAWPQAPVGLVRVVYGFTMGVLIFRCRSARPRPAVAWWLPVALAVALVVVDPPCLRQAWEVVAVAALSPLIVLAATRAEPPLALRPVCAVAGVASYLVYSLHVPIVGLVLRGDTLAHHDTQVQSPAAAIVFTVALAAVCIAAHLAYDKPVRRALMRRLDHEAPSRPRWIAVARAVKS